LRATSKAMIYAVVAIALGYALVSAVPYRFETITTKEVALRFAANESLRLGSIDELTVKPAPEAYAGGVGDWTITVGAVSADLLIALGVYFIVKRRLS